MTNDPINDENMSILSEPLRGMNSLLGSTTTPMHFMMNPIHAISTLERVQASVMVKVHHSIHVVRIDLKSEELSLSSH